MSRRSRILSISLLVCGWLLSIGCGYRPDVLGVDGRVPTLAIPIFENRSQEPVIETALTELVREEFINDGRFRIVSRDDADYLLRGSIEGYGIDPLAFDLSDNVREARVNIAVAVVLEDLRSTGEPVHYDLRARSEYLVTGFLSADEAARTDAEGRAFAELADELNELVVSTFLFP